MKHGIEHYSQSHRLEATTELRAELEEFSHDGLVQLQEDLLRHGVLRGSWAGCVISYKRGGAGSTRRDRFGRARNAFTVLWDNGWMTDEDVLRLVEQEMQRRRVRIAAAAPSPRPASRRTTAPRS